MVIRCIQKNKDYYIYKTFFHKLNDNHTQRNSKQTHNLNKEEIEEKSVEHHQKKTADRNRKENNQRGMRYQKTKLKMATGNQHI